MKKPAILATTLTLLAPPMMAADDPCNPDKGGTLLSCITSMNQRIGQLEKKVGQLETENQARKAEIKSQQADIQRLTAENKTLKSQLQQIQQVLNTKVYRAYEVIPGSFSWHEARADAEKRGGHLATITSEAEWLFIKNSLGDSLPNAKIWIGATDEGNEGHWRWVTGEPWDYTRWKTGEPNNVANREHYAHIYSKSTDYRWNDLPNRHFYVTHYLLEK
jgi:regulator of replication initiation timing